MVRAVIDTNVLVDYLQGNPLAQAELALYKRPCISIVSWMEVLASCNAQTEKAARSFLMSFDLLEIDLRVAEQAVMLRRTRRIKLPDAIIQASAQVHQCLLVSRNTRDFDANDPGIRVPYTI